jgi:hypothetical protein
MGDLIKIAGDIQVATSNHDVREFNLELPDQYAISPDSVHRVISYTQQDRSHISSHLSQTETRGIRQEAQGQAWREMKEHVLKQPGQLLNAPATIFYDAHALQRNITNTAQLQERARTAFRILESHTTLCTDLALTALGPQTERAASEQKEFVTQLVSATLNPQQTRNPLAQQHPREYRIVAETLGQANIDRAAELRGYASNARNDYVNAFTQLEQEQQALAKLETQHLSLPGANTLAGHEQLSAAEQLLANTSEIENFLLADHAQEMFATQTLPDLNQEQIGTLTVKDLLPADVREATHEDAREQAWNSFEPTELRDSYNGREVDERLVTAADQVMDTVAMAQNTELQLDLAKGELANFISNHAPDPSLNISLDEREAAQQEILNSLTGLEASQYNELRDNIDRLQTTFAQSFTSLDEKLQQLAETRIDVRIETEIAQFRELSQPAAVAINSYLKEVVREEGFAALAEPLRHDDHVERITLAIIASAEAHNIALDQSPAGMSQINEISSNLFDTLSQGLEHVNQQFQHNQDLTHQLLAPTHSTDQNQSFTQSPNGHTQNGHDQLALLGQHHDQHALLPGEDLIQAHERENILTQATPILPTIGEHAATNGPDLANIAAEQVQEAVLAL